MDDEALPDGTTILIVDDDADMRDLLRCYLEATRATLVEASDGREALSQVEKHQPDLILCDLGLPRLGGISFVERLGQDFGLSRIPVVAITGRGDESDVMEAWSAGFSGHMLKPVTKNAVLHEVRRVLSSHGA